MHKRKAARKAEEGFRRMEHEDDPYGAAARGGGAAGGGRPLARELGFLERVKQRLRNREQYSDFLKVGSSPAAEMGRGPGMSCATPTHCVRVQLGMHASPAFGCCLLVCTPQVLNLFSQEIISRQELVQLVADMFNRAPDLMVRPCVCIWRESRTGAHIKQKGSQESVHIVKQKASQPERDSGGAQHSVDSHFAMGLPCGCLCSNNSTSLWLAVRTSTLQTSTQLHMGKAF
jgi:hypothetical protein